MYSVTNTTRRSLIAIATAILVCGLSAQDSWRPLALQSTYSVGNIQQIGKVIAYREGGVVHCFSSFTRAWVAIPATGLANVRVANDWVLVTDGNTWHGFSAYRGLVESLTVSAGSSVINPPNQRNDSLVVGRDGQDLVTFSGFVGRWLRRPFPGNAQVAVQRHTLVVADGTNLAAMSAFDAAWVNTTSAAPVVAVAADGSVGYAETGTFIHGFSAHTRSWASAPALTSAAVRVVADAVLWTDGNQAMAFSGQRGSFAQVTTGSVNVQADERSAALVASSGIWLYSASLGSFQFRAGSTSNVQVRTDTILFQDNTGTVAYSALTGGVASLPGPVAQWGVNTTTAAVVDANGRAHLFSSFVPNWVSAPADALPGLLPEQTWNAAMVHRSSGYSAFSARTGQFVPLTSGSNAIAHVDANSAIIAASDDQSIHVFDPRREAWLTVVRTGTGPVQARIWRTMVMLGDGPDVLGFAATSGSLERITPVGAVLEWNANSESMRLATATTLWAFAGTGDLTSLMQFPEFRRQQTRFEPIELRLATSPSAATMTLLAFAPASSPILIPGISAELMLDPSWLLPFGGTAADSDGLVRHSIPLPDNPALTGVRPYFQALVAPRQGAPYFTRLASVSIH